MGSGNCWLKKGFHPSLKDFVSSQLREDMESNNDIQVIDGNMADTVKLPRKYLCGGQLQVWVHTR